MKSRKSDSARTKHASHVQSTSLTDGAYAEVIVDGKKTRYQIDESAPLFGFIVRQLMAYTMSQDASKLPMNVPLILLLPKKAQYSVVKSFVKQHFAVEFKISDDWTYIWDFDSRARTGWWLNGKKEEGHYED